MSGLHYFVGLGCRRGCPETTLRNVLQQALRNCGVSLAQIDGIASVDSKKDEPGLLELARSLSIPLHFFSAQHLNSFAEKISAASAAAVDAVGTASVAEASALALAESRAGYCAELIGKKMKATHATCAIACARFST